MPEGMTPEDPRMRMRYTPPQVDEGVVKWLEDSEQGLFSQCMSLRGEQEAQDDKGNAIIVKVREPIMNEAGVHYFASIARSNLRKENYLTNLPEKRIIPMFTETWDEALEHLVLHTDEYALSPENIGIVMDLLRKDTEVGFRRAIGGKEREAIFPSVKESYTQNQAHEEGEQKRGGFRFPF